MTFRPLPFLTAFSVVSLVLLYILGSWQWSRYQEKLGEIVAPTTPFQSVTLTPLSVPGKFAQQLNGTAGSGFIYRRYVPARLEGEDEVGLLMLDVTTGIEPQPLELVGLTPVSGDFAIFVPELRTNVFAADSRPGENRWTRRDAPAMLENLGLTVIDEVRVFEPRLITVVDPQLGPREIDNPYAASRPADGLPPARHLGYALTWWGLGLALFAVYIAFHVARGRLRFGSGSST